MKKTDRFRRPARRPLMRFVPLAKAARALSKDMPLQLAVTAGELAQAVREMTPRDGAYTADQVLRRLDY